MISFSEIMKGIIFKKGRGNFITPEDFGSQVSPASLRTELVNFNNSHFLIHIARGLYYFPHIGRDKKQVRPTILDIVRYVEESTGSIVFPTAEAACKLVGLNETFMTSLEFYTSGYAKRINLIIGPELVFKKFKNSDEFPNYSSLKVRVLVIAYNSISNKQITVEQKNAINNFCATMSYEDIAKDFVNLPDWLKDNIVFPQPNIETI